MGDSADAAAAADPNPFGASRTGTRGLPVKSTGAPPSATGAPPSAAGATGATGALDDDIDYKGITSAEGLANSAILYTKKNYRKPLTKLEAFKLRYKNLYDMFVVDTPTRIKTPLTKNQSSCPVFNGKRGLAYERPIREWDQILRTQYTVQQKDYLGQNQTFFCYPDGMFDGYDFPRGDPNDETNVPVDLKLTRYGTPKQMIGGLKVMLDLMAPDHAITNIDEQRAEMTDMIVKLQKDKQVEARKKQALVALCKFMAKKSPALQGYHSMERKLKEAKKKVMPWLETVHLVALANIGLGKLLEFEKSAHCKAVKGEYKTDMYNLLENCVPTQTFKDIEEDESLLTVYNRNLVIKYLIKYAQDIVKLAEKFEPVNWQSRFMGLTAEQKNRFKPF